jgi:peptidoglycan/LPS O-acetylase OafA/YrhL
LETSRAQQGPLTGKEEAPSPAGRKAFPVTATRLPHFPPAPCFPGFGIGKSSNTGRKGKNISLTKRQIIPALTGLRGAAAIWVFLYHLFPSYGVPGIENGFLGVDVFFLLSGYVLSHVYADRVAPTDITGYLRFLRVRIARIFPLHVFTLCLLGLIVLFLPGFADRYSMPEQRWSLGAFIASFFLVQDWAFFLPDAWNGPSWSLSAEWFAYLIFPLFMFATQWPRSKALPLVLAACSLIVFYVVFTLKGIDNPSAGGTPGMVRMVCEFSVGCLLYRATANGLGRLPVAVDVAAVALLLAAMALDGAALFLLALPAFALIILLATQNGPIAKALGSAPVVFLGEISYSIYLLHWILIQVSNWIMDERVLLPLGVKLLWDAGLFALCLALATLTYRGIELPARAWGRRIATKPARLPSAA